MRFKVIWEKHGIDRISKLISIYCYRSRAVDGGVWYAMPISSHRITKHIIERICFEPWNNAPTMEAAFLIALLESSCS